MLQAGIFCNFAKSSINYKFCDICDNPVGNDIPVLWCYRCQVKIYQTCDKLELTLGHLGHGNPENL